MKRSLVLIALAPLLVSLTGCTTNETQEVLGFVEEWLDAEGVMYLMASRGYEEAIDAGMMVKEIKNLDKTVDKADEELDKRPPNYDGALKGLDYAVGQRPNDWYYRNHRGIVLNEKGDSARAKADLQLAEKACKGNQRCLQAMYEDREKALNGAYIRTYSSDNRKRDCWVYQEQAATYGQLATLTSNPVDKNRYLGKQQAAVTNSQPGLCNT